MATKKKEAAPIPCSYACGRHANGTIMLNYTPFGEDGYRRGIQFAFPCCDQCLHESVPFAIKMPEKKE